MKLYFAIALSLFGSDASNSQCMSNHRKMWACTHYTLHMHTLYTTHTLCTRNVLLIYQRYKPIMSVEEVF